MSSHVVGGRNKIAIFDIMKAAGQIESRGGWDWHHVVEGQHYADVDHRGHLDWVYKHELPCVLLNADEHHAYNGLLHSRESLMLFRDPSLPRLAGDRMQTIASGPPGDRVRLRARIAGLRSLYRESYDGDAVLITIADNVFDEVLESLR